MGLLSETEHDVLNIFHNNSLYGIFIKLQFVSFKPFLKGLNEPKRRLKTFSSIFRRNKSIFKYFNINIMM